MRATPIYDQLRSGDEHDPDRPDTSAEPTSSAEVRDLRRRGGMGGRHREDIDHSHAG